MKSLVPVNVLTGFLGSAKTTQLNRLLRQPAFGQCAVLINEFGAVGIDHHLIERAEGDLVLLKSGCICCTIRGDLAEAIRRLHDRHECGEVPAYDRIVIETTGLADPMPVLATILHDRVLRHHYRAGNVLATVDSLNGAGQLEEYPESRKQAALADRLLLTKTDLCSADAVRTLRERLSEVNPAAEIIELGGGEPDADLLLGSDIFSADGKAVEVARCLRAAGALQYFPVHRGDSGLHRDIQSFVLTMPDEVEWAAFSLWLSLLLHRHGTRVLRIKGLLAVRGSAEPVVLHGVQQLIHPPSHLREWPSGTRASRIVFIVRGLSPQGVEDSLKAGAARRRLTFQPVRGGSKQSLPCGNTVQKTSVWGPP
ncbi:MAG: GTP-binding protein [Ramlibacter sp.]|nr:GTP-binding protein [Ramlibacter sp.]